MAVLLQSSEYLASASLDVDQLASKYALLSTCMQARFELNLELKLVIILLFPFFKLSNCLNFIFQACLASI